MSVAAPLQPLFEFKFDELGLEGAQAKDTGAVGRDQRMLSNIDTWTQGDRRTPGGEGVSGKSTDRALDSRNASSMGSAADGSGVLIYPANTQGPEIDQLASFTISGWYKTENARLGGSARLFKFQNGAAGFDAQITGELNLEVGGVKGGGASTLRSLGLTPTNVNEWVFWAITYDGTKTTNNAIAYIGTIGSPVTQVGMNTIDQGVVSSIAANYGGFNITRAVDGLIDNLRVFGSKTNGSGALILADLEQYRLGDVPPPSLPRPLFEFKFEELGDDLTRLANNTGTVGRDQLMTTNNATWAPGDARGAGGTGVSGKPTDRALESLNLNNTGQADGGTGIAMYTIASKAPEIDSLTSFTLSGWYKTVDIPLGGSARLFRMPPAIDVEIVGTFGIELKGVAMDPERVTLGTTPGNVNEWVYWAITYDGASTTNNVKAYIGLANSPVALLGEASSLQGIMDTAALSYGGWNQSRGIKGYLDNLRIFGNKTNSSGVLSREQLEQYRLADVTGPVPLTLSISRDGNDVVLSWDSTSAVLHGASTLTGPYTEIVGATSPHRVPITGTKMFFKVATGP